MWYIIRYTALYIYKKNRLIKQEWQTIITRKDSRLINSGLQNGFWAKAMEITNYLQNMLFTKSCYGKMISKES